jgi:hypothetical protein
MTEGYDVITDGSGYEPARSGRFSRFFGFFRPRRFRWAGPAPLGAVVAVLLITMIVLAVPAAVAARWSIGRAQPRPLPPQAPPAAVTSPGPLYSAPPGMQSDNPPADPPYIPPLAPVLPGDAGPVPSGQPAAGGGSGLPATTTSGMSFVAVSGVGGPATASASTFAAYPAGNPVATKPTGGLTDQGCNGRFWSVSMSGSPTQADPGTHVLWWFVTNPVTTGTCGIQVYVPKGDQDTDVAGDPAAYQVLRGRDSTDVIGTFSIKQAAHRGTWVSGGSFHIDGGQIAVNLLNRGAGAGGARLGAAQVMVSCKP